MKREKNLFEDGLIPAHTECPFKHTCDINKLGHCDHEGTAHSNDYSCGAFRYFKICERDITPIDISKPVKTRSGKKVVGLKRVPVNSCGNKVTYPLKGSIVAPRNAPKYQIWTDDGMTDCVFNNFSEDDLIQE